MFDFERVGADMDRIKEIGELINKKDYSRAETLLSEYVREVLDTLGERYITVWLTKARPENKVMKVEVVVASSIPKAPIKVKTITRLGEIVYNIAGYVYGRIPPNTPEMTAEEISQTIGYRITANVPIGKTKLKPVFPESVGVGEPRVKYVNIEEMKRQLAEAIEKGDMERAKELDEQISRLQKSL